MTDSSEEFVQAFVGLICLVVVVLCAIFGKRQQVGGTILTVDVAQLVDASNAQLVKTLNERSQIPDPAWILYSFAAVCASLP